MKIDWDRIKEYFRWKDDGTIPWGWLVIISIIGLVLGIKYGTTIVYPTM